MAETWTDEVAGAEAKVFYGDAQPATTEITGIQECTPPEIEFDEVDTKHSASTDRCKTSRPGWMDPGECAITAKFKPSVFAAVKTIAEARTVKKWMITFIDGSKVQFDGWVKSMGTPVDIEQLVQSTITVRVTGKPTFTAPA